MSKTLPNDGEEEESGDVVVDEYLGTLGWVCKKGHSEKLSFDMRFE